MLDYTRTKGGRGALYHRIEHPLTDPQDIRHVQSGIGFLLEHEVAFPIDEELIRKIKRYLDSSWVIGLKRRGFLRVLESRWVAWRYSDFMGYVDEGVSVVMTLLYRVQELLGRLQGLNPLGEVGDLVEQLANLIAGIAPEAIRTERDPAVILETDRILRERHRAAVLQVIELSYELDALCSMATASSARGLAFPEIVDDEEFLLEGDGVFHLFLEDPVVNPVKLDSSKSLMFLTGPNMAGKTTYMKAVAVAVVLAQVGMGVPATSFRLAPLQGLFASLTPEDNMRSGLSYFMAEVRRIREIVEGVLRCERSLVLVEEVFKGTNINDSLEASRLVIRGFSRNRTSGFIVSSHLVELAEELKDRESIQFSYFDGTVEDGMADYQYTVRPGVSDQRFGLHLLEQDGVPQLLDKLGTVVPGDVTSGTEEPL